MHGIRGGIYLVKEEMSLTQRFLTTRDVSLEQIMGAMYACKDEITSDIVFVGNVDMTSLFQKVKEKTIVLENEDKRLALFPCDEDSYLVIGCYNYTVMWEYPNVGDMVAKDWLKEHGYGKIRR